MMKGKILWIDHRDENGIIKDEQGNEYYFDVSSVNHKYFDELKSGQSVTFKPNDQILHCLCATKVTGE